MSWAEERAAERSPAVRRSRSRIADQVRSILDAAQRLIEIKGDAFTTQELTKEAGVALQTFYRYFGSKDELLLAVLGDAMETACLRWTAAASNLDDPLQRLHFYITSILGGLGQEPRRDALAQFIVTTHWRLHRVFPEELAKAEQPFVDLLHTEIRAAVERGQLKTANTAGDAWFVSELVRSVYHYWAYAPGDAEDVQDRLWEFVLRALGGVAKP
ncbi:TetR family transcriptional regulator [Rhodococcus oxybenzonivorans]|uniref:TetR family transcriptional regulator n=1 Tax=Rhodococcus oxybenzonivorans TaxID=1990687 RepID=A0A2S2BRA4_9NOCA|nr:TetR/AcrR family transcriptional regulator [Rhodococcus oxybenzonivorans]AWK71131.1 TetR family transcriptional regulator [Rhodococcus oxybenzonivorans]